MGFGYDPHKLQLPYFVRDFNEIYIFNGEYTLPAFWIELCKWNSHFKMCTHLHASWFRIDFRNDFFYTFDGSSNQTIHRATCVENDYVLRVMQLM